MVLKISQLHVHVFTFSRPRASNALYRTASCGELREERRLLVADMFPVRRRLGRCSRRIYITRHLRGRTFWTRPASPWGRRRTSTCPSTLHSLTWVSNNQKQKCVKIFGLSWWMSNWALSNGNFREKAVKASMLSRRKNFLKRQKTTQSWGTILIMIACLRIIQIESTHFSYGAHTLNTCTCTIQSHR